MSMIDTINIVDLLTAAAQNGVEVWISKSGSVRIRPMTEASKMTSTERVKRFRDKKRGNAETLEVNETVKRNETHETEGNVSPSSPPSLPPAPTPTGAHTREPEPQAWMPCPAKRQVGKWFHRRESTPWTVKELKAWAAIPADSIREGLDILHAPYTARERYCRKDLLTLLNNWQGEVDRWRSYQPVLQSDVQAIETDNEELGFLTNDDAIFHKDRP